MHDLMRAMLAGVLLWWTASTHAQVAADPVNLSGLWYSEAEAGHGVNITHQGSILFVAWYVYGADGKVLWMVSPATRQADGSYSGDLARPATGTPFNLINGPATTFPLPVAGNFTLSFSNGENANFR